MKTKLISSKRLFKYKLQIFFSLLTKYYKWFKINKISNEILIREKIDPCISGNGEANTIYYLSKFLSLRLNRLKFLKWKKLLIFYKCFFLEQNNCLIQLKISPPLENYFKHSPANINFPHALFLFWSNSECNKIFLRKIGWN